MNSENGAAYKTTKCSREKATIIITEPIKELIVYMYS